MAQKSIQGNRLLANTIRSRRQELGLTIEEAATRAGVGTKTWSRYEAGESIRLDKCKGLCRALNWKTIPSSIEADDPEFHLEQYQQDEAWPTDIEEAFGEYAAASFVIGSEMLLDNLQLDMCELSRLPKGAHLGQLGFSVLLDSLPPQFLTQYDYDFLYALKFTVLRMREQAHRGIRIVAHSVLAELALYLIAEFADGFFETVALDTKYSSDWVFDLFDDMDIVTFLYSDAYLSCGHPYHFDRWMEHQFYMPAADVKQR